MAPSLESGVEHRLESPTPGKEVRLIVGIEARDEEAMERLEESGATVHDRLPLDYVSLTIAEENLGQLCELPFVTSVELDSEGTVFESDFRSPLG